MMTNLRTILMADGVMSGVAGLAMALGAQVLGPLTGLPDSLLQVAGAALAPWTAALIWLARRHIVPRAGVIAVIAINIAWVLASVAVLFAFAPTTFGYVFVIAQAVAVGLFAELQILALRRAPTAA
jgi:hypothetical protein